MSDKSVDTREQSPASEVRFDATCSAFDEGLLWRNDPLFSVLAWSLSIYVAFLVIVFIISIIF